MDNLIGNNAKFIVEWGQVFFGGLILLAIFLLYRLLKSKNRPFTNAILKYSSAVFLILFMLIGALAFAKVTSIKPRISLVINGLESLLNESAPTFEFTVLNEESVKTLSLYRGKVVLLNYWATWCGPCLRELPELDQLQKTYADQGLVVIALSDESQEDLQKFASKHPYSLTTAYTTDFYWADVQTERPVSFLINEEGVVIDYFTGGYDYDYFESKVAGYLAMK